MAIVTGAFGLVGLVAGGIIAAASSSRKKWGSSIKWIRWSDEQELDVKLCCPTLVLVTICRLGHLFMVDWLPCVQTRGFVCNVSLRVDTRPPWVLGFQNFSISVLLLLLNRWMHVKREWDVLPPDNTVQNWIIASDGMIIDCCLCSYYPPLQTENELFCLLIIRVGIG
jgi:hypothetical protein